MDWDKTGKRVVGYYLNESRYPFEGVILNSRVKYGAAVQHHVKLDDPINFYGSIRNEILVEDNELEVIG